jgi:hypothetical protein
MSVCRKVCLSRRKRSTFSLGFCGVAGCARDSHLRQLIAISFTSLPVRAHAQSSASASVVGTRV